MTSTCREWRHDNRYLRYAIRCPLDEIREAHLSAKAELIAAVARRTKTTLDARALLVGFARRATPYKRANLIFHDVARLRSIARDPVRSSSCSPERRIPGTTVGRR